MTQVRTAQGGAAVHPFGKWGEPAAMGVYGEIGTGKTVDATLFDPIGWTLALPGSIKSSEWFLGPLYAYAQQMVVPVVSVEDVIGFMENMVAGKVERRTVRIDDLSVLATTTVSRLREKYPASKSFAMWDELKRLMDRLKQAIKAAGVHVIAGFHLAHPKTSDSGIFNKGGPDCGGPQAMNIIVGVLDVLYKAEADTTAWPYPAVYRNDNPSPTWHFKDRHSIVFGVAPMNLREIIRAAGYTVARPPGYEWLDDIAESVAGQITGGADRRAVFEAAVRHLMAQGVYVGHAYWACRDGLDRAKLAGGSNPFLRALSTSGVGGPGVPAVLPPPATK